MSGPRRAAGRQRPATAVTVGRSWPGGHAKRSLVGWPAEGYIFGAVCPARGTGAALVLPYADKHAMTLHLAEISQAVAPGAHAVVIVDGAGWHKPGGRLKLPENISTLVLPSYSPELNPQENIWQYLRQNYLSNRVFKTYSGIVDAC